MIVLRFVVTDFIGDVIERTAAATRTAYTSWFATGTRVFLYFTAVAINFDTMGIDITLLNVVVQALAWGLAAAVALGVGIELGWEGKDYVSENMGRAYNHPSGCNPTLGLHLPNRLITSVRSTNELYKQRNVRRLIEPELVHFNDSNPRAFTLLSRNKSSFDTEGIRLSSNVLIDRSPVDDPPKSYGPSAGGEQG